MFARRRGEDVAGHVEPESEQRADASLASRLAVLRAKRLLHVASVVGAEVERKHTQDGAKDPIGPRGRTPGGAHTDLGRGTSFFSRAISTIDSSRSISAAATLRPSGVRR